MLQNILQRESSLSFLCWHKTDSTADGYAKKYISIDRDTITHSERASETRLTWGIARNDKWHEIAMKMNRTRKKQEAWRIIYAYEMDRVLQS